MPRRLAAPGGWSGRRRRLNGSASGTVGAVTDGMPCHRMNIGNVDARKTLMAGAQRPQVRGCVGHAMGSKLPQQRVRDDLDHADVAFRLALDPIARHASSRSRCIRESGRSPQRRARLLPTPGRAASGRRGARQRPPASAPRPCGAAPGPGTQDPPPAVGHRGMPVARPPRQNPYGLRRSRPRRRPPERWIRSRRDAR